VAKAVPSLRPALGQARFCAPIAAPPHAQFLPRFRRQMVGDPTIPWAFVAARHGQPSKVPTYHLPYVQSVLVPGAAVRSRPTANKLKAHLKLRGHNNPFVPQGQQFTRNPLCQICRDVPLRACRPAASGASPKMGQPLALKEKEPTAATCRWPFATA